MTYLLDYLAKRSLAGLTQTEIDIMKETRVREFAKRGGKRTRPEYLVPGPLDDDEVERIRKMCEAAEAKPHRKAKPKPVEPEITP